MLHQNKLVTSFKLLAYPFKKHGNQKTGHGTKSSHTKCDHDIFYRQVGQYAKHSSSKNTDAIIIHSHPVNDQHPAADCYLIESPCRLYLEYHHHRFRSDLLLPFGSLQ